MDTLKQNKKQLEEAVANKLKEAKSLEEVKNIAANEGYELSDEQLEGVAGGFEMFIRRDPGCPDNYCVIIN